MRKVSPVEDAIPSSHTSGTKQEMTTLKVSKVTREAVTTGARAKEIGEVSPDSLDEAMSWVRRWIAI